jgi:hypothetical protein
LCCDPIDIARFSHGYPPRVGTPIALKASQKRYGLVTMCIGGGQGIAAVFERM